MDVHPHVCVYVCMSVRMEMLSLVEGGTARARKVEGCGVAQGSHIMWDQKGGWITVRSGAVPSGQWQGGLTEIVARAVGAP